MNVAFEHLLHLSDATGTFEHADHDEARVEHGYCVDDVARVLVAVCQTDRSEDRRLELLEERSLGFLIESMSYQGKIRNRRRDDGEWTSDYGTGDWWGRALWGFGVCARRGHTVASRHLALQAFTLCSRQTSTSPRSLGFATLGAVDVLWEVPTHTQARRLAVEFAEWFDRQLRSTAWPWPEERLAYANAAICDALIVAGHVCDRLDLVRSGLDLLSWLIDLQSLDGHLSLVPAGGAGPSDAGPRFDQQPIEVGRLADACERAYAATADSTWIDHVRLCAEWFDGRNDLGVLMWDPETGAGFDGLTPHGPNLNRGAESTLAAITTAQVHYRLQSAASLN